MLLYGRIVRQSMAISPNPAESGKNGSGESGGHCGNAGLVRVVCELIRGSSCESSYALLRRELLVIDPVISRFGPACPSGLVDRVIVGCPVPLRR
jgi:hypothetical protein